MPTFDLLIRGGTVYDGSGGEPFAADVAVNGDRIAVVGRPADARAGAAIDAAGLAVAPGFINMLSHSSITMLHDGRSLSELMQGVTTQIFGEGTSMGPLTEDGRRRLQAQEPALTYSPNDPRLHSDLTEQRIRDATAEQLDQRGLRPAAGGTPADLRVQAALIVENKQNQVSTYHGGFWGGPWGGYWGGPAYTETRTLDYQVGTLQIDLIDGRDGKLVWRGSARQVLRNNPSNPAERAAAIRETVARVLAQYPPR